MIDSDVDPDAVATVFHINTPVARKEHECLECQETIKPGERYELCEGLYNDRQPKMFKSHWSAVKTCWICREIRNCYMCNWYSGRVWEGMHGWFEWAEWDPCMLDKLSTEARAVMIDWLDENFI